MSAPVTIVVLAKYRDIFTRFAESVDKYCSGVPVVYVRDGNDIPFIPSWTLIQGPEKFSMAGNGNLGLRAVELKNDVLYCGDDVRFLENNTVEKLNDIAYSDPKIGILSPKILGRGSRTQLAPTSVLTVCSPIDMWFPCVYIKRSLIDSIGYLDEQFDDFGSDDLDYCIRCLLGGFTLAVTSAVAVQHDAGPDDSPTTFVRTIGNEDWERQRSISLRRVRDKYHASRSAFAQFLKSGDVRHLQPNRINV